MSKIEQLAELAIEDILGVKIINRQKFAELIINECAFFIEDTLDDHFAAEQLREYFGI